MAVAHRRILKPETEKVMQSAKNPLTPTSKLVSFAKAPWNALPKAGHALRCAVALNPNTPIDALRLLSTKGYQRLVKRNPVTALLLVENPALNLATGPQQGFFTLERAVEARRESRQNTRKRAHDLTAAQLLSFCQLAEQLQRLCDHYYLPISVASVSAVGPLEALPPKQRQWRFGAGMGERTQLTTIASWYGFLHTTMIDVSRLYAMRPKFSGLQTHPATVSGRIDMNSSVPAPIRSRLLEMLRREGYTPESPSLKKLGKGLAVYVSGKQGLESKYPTLYFKQTTGDPEQDKFLFDHFTAWNPA